MKKKRLAKSDASEFSRPFVITRLNIDLQEFDRLAYFSLCKAFGRYYWQGRTGDGIQFSVEITRKVSEHIGLLKRSQAMTPVRRRSFLQWLDNYFAACGY
jgi:hypothetical protein